MTRKEKPIFPITIQTQIRARDEAEARKYGKQIANELRAWPVVADAMIESFEETLAYIGTRTW